MDLNLQALRIFCQVVADGSFSKAARSLGIAQPTVSQQIARIEHLTGGRLFERVGKNIYLTALGRESHLFALELVDKADQFAEKLKDQRGLPSGLVRYAMPETCQWTPHYRKIMAQLINFPGVRFDIQILENDQILKLLLEGQIDFGFVTGERLRPELRFEKFSNEHYSMVAAEKDLFSPIKLKNISELRLISFPGWELFFTTWAKSFSILADVKKQLPSSTVHVSSLSGAIHAVQEGAGVAVIPTHCVFPELESQRLFAYKSPKSTEPVNSIHIVRRHGEKLSRRVELVLDMLRKTKKVERS